MPVDPLTLRYTSRPGQLAQDPLTHRYTQMDTKSDDAVSGVGKLLGLPFDIISTIVQETGRDLEGVLNTGVAFGGSIASLLGSTVPYTMEDLESRDIKGTLMLGALLASGGVTHLAKGIPAFAKLAQTAQASKMTRLLPGQRLAGTGARAAFTGGTEVLAGATFGMLRPLEADESRMKAVLGDAAVFGGIGVGASFAKTAFMTTLGIPVMKMAKGVELQMSGAAAEATAKGMQVKEMIGQRYRNPKTKVEATIFRHADDSEKFSIIYSDGSANGSGVIGAGENLKTPLAKLAGEGFIEPLGPPGVNPLGVGKANPKWTEESLEELVPKEWIDLIRQQELTGGEKLTDILQGIKLEEYSAARKAATAAITRDGIETELTAQYLTDSVNELGVFRFSDSSLKKEVVKYLPELDDLQRHKLINNPNSDPEILRLAMQNGIANVETLKHGMHVRDWMRELTYNDLAPKNMALTVIPNDDLFFKWFMTTRTIAKMHPEIQPLFDSMTRFINGKKEKGLHGTERIFQAKKALEPFGDYNPKTQVSRNTSTKAKEVMDEGYEYVSHQVNKGFFDLNQPSAVEDMNAMARRYTKERVEELAKTRPMGDINYDHLKQMVNFGIDVMDEYGEELVRIGRIDKTQLRPGYFSIMNNLQGNKWKASVTTKGGKGQPLGWFGSKQEAEQAAFLKRSENPAKYSGHSISQVDQAVPLESLMPLNRKDLKKVLAKSGDDALYDIRSPMAYERTLNVRDFEHSDFFDIISSYQRSADRAIALHESGFSEIGRQVSESISGSKPVLKNWVDQRIGVVAGKASKQEVAVQNFVEGFGRAVGHQFKPEVLKRWAIGMRQWESFSRLFGVSSPLVNMTQVAINTYPKLGAKYTAMAMKDVLSPTQKGKAWRDNLRKMMHEFDAGLDFIVPFGDATGGLGGTLSKMESQTWKGTLRRREFGELLNRSALFMFNGVEEMNRIITWHGAYMKKMAEVGDHQIAGRFATKTMFETQFDYSMANMPEVLTTPIGGLLGQFKSFFINEVEFIAKLSPQERKRFAVAMQALGGTAALFNMPGPDMLSAGKGLFFDTTIEEDLKLEQAVPGLKNISPALSKFTSFGFPGLAEGLTGGLAPNTSISDYVGVGGFADMTKGILGPFGSDVMALKDFIMNGTVERGMNGSLSEGTYNRFLQKTMPSQLRRLLNGTRILESGEVRDPYSGKLIYRPDDRYETGMMAIVGPPTVEIQQEKTKDFVVSKIRTRYNETRATFAKDAARAMIEGRGPDAQRIMEQARGQGFEVSKQSLNYWVKELKSTSAERRFRAIPVNLRTNEDLQRYFEVNGSLPEEIERAIRATEGRRIQSRQNQYPSGF